MKQRTHLMGYAMLMVLIYHYGIWVFNPFGELNIGYIGVDIFLFLSGAGLVHSFQTTPLKTFYYKRFRRIYPLFALTTILTFGLSQAYCGKTFLNATADLLGRLTTLNAYNLQNTATDWYLSTLLLAYLLFPLCYLFIQKFKFLSILLCFISITLLILYLAPLHWKFDCPLSRLPIFCLGIWAMQRHFFTKSQIYCLLILPLLFIPLILPFSHFLAWSCLTPLLLFVCYQLSLHWRFSIITFLGKYSLEIYCANLLVEVFIRQPHHYITRTFLYFFLQLIGTLFFLLIQKKGKAVADLFRLW